MQICDGILEAIGQTPLIRLRRFLPEARFHLFAKLEALNPGGSIKDRPASLILGEALRSGALRQGSVVVESSSGNMGIGLAQICRFHGLRFICVVDPKTSDQNIEILRAYGAEVDHVAEPDPATGEFLVARLNRVRQLVSEIDGAFWPNQYENLGNPGSHYRSTMTEIAAALDGKVDVLLVPTSTCGTIRGCAEYARDHGLGTRVIAVDAVGSLIFADRKAKRSIPGLGAGLRPPLCDVELTTEYILIDDRDCVRGCHLLIEREAIFAGGSGGGVMSALLRLQDEIPDGAHCVVILPDRGERYLNTVYNDAWVESHVGPPVEVRTAPERPAGPAVSRVDPRRGL